MDLQHKNTSIKESILEYIYRGSYGVQVYDEERSDKYETILKNILAVDETDFKELASVISKHVKEEIESSIKDCLGVIFKDIKEILYKAREIRAAEYEYLEASTVTNYIAEKVDALRVKYLED